MSAGTIVTRFAPSPTGHLHLGHVLSAFEGWRAAREAGGRFLLRLEDIDRGRCREEYAAAIIEDLAWLGLDWDGPVRRQSEHFDDYRTALDRLDALGVLYRCFCTRREIRAEIAQADGAPQGDAAPPYPGICRRLTAATREAKRRAGLDYALRLDLARALELTGPVEWVEEGGGEPCRVLADPAAARRCRARPQGHACQLSPGGYGRRRHSRRHPCHARRGFGAVDAHPSHLASIA